VKRIYRNSNRISESAFIAVIADLHRWYKGWFKLFLHFLLWLSAVLTAYFLLFSSVPYGYNQENTLVSLFESVTFGESEGTFLDVQNNADFNEYMYALIGQISRPDPNDALYQCKFDSFDESQCLNETYLSLYSSNCSALTNGSLFLDNANRVQFGLLILQERVEFGDCEDVIGDIMDSLFGLDSKPCISDTKTTHFRENFVPPQDAYFRESFLFNEQFDSFPLFLDIGLRNLNPEHSICEAEVYFNKYKWVDEQTKRLQVILLIQNRNGLGRYALSSLDFEFSPGGFVSKVLYRSSAIIEKRQLAVNLANSVYLLLVLVHIFYLCEKILVRKKSLIRSGTRMLEGLFLLFNMVTVVLTFLFVNKFYDDFQLEAMIREKQISQSSNGFLDDLLGLLTPIFLLLRNQQVMISLYAFTFVITGFVTVARFDFHPDLAFISQTVRKGGKDLLTFALVFLILVLSYAIVGVTLFSAIDEQFSSILTAAGVLIFVGGGEIESFIELIYDDNAAAVHGEFLLRFYLWSYFFFVTLILFNILLSIIVEAFFRYKTDRIQSLTVFESFFLAVRMAAFDVKQKFWTFSLRKKQEKPATKLKNSERNSSREQMRNDHSAENSNKNMKKAGNENGVGRYLNFAESLNLLNKSMSHRHDIHVHTLRLKLSELMGTYFADRIISILRRRTTEIRNIESRTHVGLIFPDHSHSAHQVSLLLKIREMLHKAEQQREHGRKSTQ